MKPSRCQSMTNLAIFCVLFVLALLLYHDPFLLLWWPQKPAEHKQIILPLDMATESIDDMFEGCRPEAASMIDLFGVFEWHYNRNFSYAWAVAERTAKKPAHKQLKKDHAIALYLYTHMKSIQRTFNRAVKTGKHKYNSYGFMFHYLYFYLTDAIQALRQNTTGCITSFLRTRTQFNRNVINTKMRFGAFTWAAPSKQSFQFNGDVSCFEVESCLSADITYYSATTQRGQVLIPPYEVFHITNVLTNEPWCSVVYKLQSTRTPRTDLNCKLSQKQIQNYFRGVSKNWQPISRAVMISICAALLFVISLVLLKHRQKCFVAAVLFALFTWTVILIILRITL